jgi:hypothetical protein
MSAIRWTYGTRCEPLTPPLSAESVQTYVLDPTAELEGQIADVRRQVAAIRLGTYGRQRAHNALAKAVERLEQAHG